jgi:hypothetical protein
MRRDRAAPLAYCFAMPLLRRAVKLVAATFGFLLYVWYAAVRATPEVKRRKAARRAARRPS